MEKTYLGDGVYAQAEDDTLNVILTTENGVCATITIVLEPEVLAALDKFVRAWIYERNGAKRG